MALAPETLVRRLDESFGASVYPGDERIVDDSSGTDLESMQIMASLRGLHWRDVPFETLERLRSALPFLTAEGYRFYLPAFMVMCIVDFPRAEIIADEIVRSLTPPLPSDVDRLSELAQAHPEMQPFESHEWDRLMATMRDAHAPGGPIASTFLQRVSGFTPQQARAVREFLEYLRDVHGDEFAQGEPQQALSRYWSAEH